MAVRLCEFESHPPYNLGAIAQLVEQRTENPCVPGSIPGGTTSVTSVYWSIRLSVRTRDFHSLKSSSTLLWTTRTIKKGNNKDSKSQIIKQENQPGQEKATS